MSRSALRTPRWSSRRFPELDPGSKPCYVKTKGITGSSYTRGGDDDRLLTTTTRTAFFRFEAAASGPVGVSAMLEVENDHAAQAVIECVRAALDGVNDDQVDRTP